MIIIIRFIELSREGSVEIVLDAGLWRMHVLAIEDTFHLGTGVIAKTRPTNIEPSVGIHLELEGQVIQLLDFLLSQVLDRTVFCVGNNHAQKFEVCE